MKNLGHINIRRKHLKVAVEWHAIITRDDVSVDNWTQFTEWLEADPMHSNAYNYVAELGGFIEDNSSAILDREAEKQQDGTFGSGYWQKLFIEEWPKAVVATVMLLLIASISIFYSPSVIPIEYETKKGQTKVAQLNDGSTIEINSGTNLSVEYSEEGRFIKLNFGEAFFRVKPDSKRPFHVDMGDHLVKVVGTSFNAKKRGEIMSLSVTEGLVKVQNNTFTDFSEPAIEMSPGTKYQYNPASGVELSKIPIEHIRTWTNGYLVFENEPISNIIDELDQYFDKKVVLDNGIRDMKFSGQLQVAEQYEVLSLIAYTLNLDVSEKQNIIYLQPN